MGPRGLWWWRRRDDASSTPPVVFCRLVCGGGKKRRIREDSGREQNTKTAQNKTKKPTGMHGASSGSCRTTWASRIGPCHRAPRIRPATRTDSKKILAPRLRLGRRTVCLRWPALRSESSGAPVHGGVVFVWDQSLFWNLCTLHVQSHAQSKLRKGACSSCRTVSASELLRTR